MDTERRTVGRTLRRPAALAAVTLVVAVAAVGLTDRTDHVERGPVAERNPNHVPPTDGRVGDLRIIAHTTAPERLIVDTVPPTESEEPVLLWFQGTSVSRTHDGEFVALDGAGGVIRFDRHLVPHRVSLALDGREPLGIVPIDDGGYWIADIGGGIHRANAEGRIVQTTASPFGTATLADDPQGGAWVVRSPRLFSFRMPSTDDPLLVRIDAAGRLGQTVGAIVVPRHTLLAEIANAGHVAIGDEAIFFAPFIRDEVTAISRSGDSLWTATRGLPQSTEDPRFEVGADGAEIDYAPVNLGIELGPDGLLYVLSVPGFTTSESRLDVFDPSSGALLRTAVLDDPLPTLAADPSGRVYHLDPFRLLTGVAATEREALPGFDLPTLQGDRLTNEALRGQVVLMNFWASWCAPCREEMPALDSLRHEIDDPAFEFITMNEDIETSKARAFIDEFGFEFPVVLGGGKQRDRYHYYGLPFTVLIDREGRVVQRWIGFAGEDQIAGIKAVVRAELERGAGGSADHTASSTDGAGGQHQH